MKFVQEQKEPIDKRVIWTTEKIDRVKDSIAEGYEIPVHPFFEGSPDWKSGDIVFEYTEDEISEIKKCAKDIVYFANKYCYVMTDQGYDKIELRDYQVDMLRNYQENRFNITLAPRQIGKTVVSSIYLVWYLTFQFDKNVLLMSNKGATTKEILDKIKEIIINLPFFLKPGVRKKDVMSMAFDNKCRIVGQNTTKTGGIGFTIHLLYIDEFAHIPNNIIDEFYGNVYPTLSSSKVSRIVITSTPSGFNLFHKLYVGALDGMNEYFPFRVDWWQVPGRDEDWKAREISNLGSEEEFNKQYGCQFLSSDLALLNSDDLKWMKNNSKEFEFVEFDALDDLGIDYSSLKWDPEIDIDDELAQSNNFFAISLDMGEGLGRDYTILNIFKLVPLDTNEVLNRGDKPTSINDFFGLQQIGIFRSNLHTSLDMSLILYTLCVHIFDSENCRLIVEYNTYGAELMRNLVTVYPNNNNFDEGMIIRYHHRIGSNITKPGIRYNKESKKLYVQKFKRAIERRRMILKHNKTIEECNFFTQKENGTFSAQSGHDDCVMSSVSASTFLETIEFIEYVEELYDNMDHEWQSQVETSLEKFSDDDEDGWSGLF